MQQDIYAKKSFKLDRAHTFISAVASRDPEMLKRYANHPLCPPPLPDQDPSEALIRHTFYLIVIYMVDISYLIVRLHGEPTGIEPGHELKKVGRPKVVVLPAEFIWNLSPWRAHHHLP